MKKIVIGISGASGAIYGIRMLEVLRELHVETHLVITKAGKVSIEHETDYKLDEVINLAHFYYHNNNIAAKIASGSFLHDGMVIAPTTAKTLAEVASSASNHLISRAADVTLKERRKLILLFRETPYNLAHIKRMEEVTMMGAIVMPPVTTFYNRPLTLSDMVDHTIGRTLDLLSIEHDLMRRWEGL